MKVIDLLNKIANGEIPKRIKYNNIDYKWDSKKQDYDSYNTSHLQTGILGYIGTYGLDKEVEIIEEDKKIEKIDRFNLAIGENGERISFSIADSIIVDTVNEIIDRLNNEK